MSACCIRERGVLTQTPFQPLAAIAQMAPQLPEKGEIRGYVQHPPGVTHVALPREGRSYVGVLRFQVVENLLRLRQIGRHPGIERVDEGMNVGRMAITNSRRFAARQQLF